VVSGGGHLFPVSPTHHQAIYAGQYWFGAGEFFAPNPPAGEVLTYYLPRPAPGGTAIAIRDAAGATVRTLRGPGEAGLNRACWDLRRAPAAAENAASPAPCVPAAPDPGSRGAAATVGPVAPPGKYSIAVTPAGGATLAADFTLLPDPSFAISDADRTTRENALMSAYALQRQLAPARESARTLSDRILALRESAGESGRATLNRISADVVRCQNQVSAAMVAAGRVQVEIDSYDGVPTAAQLAELDRAWSAAEAAATSFNQTVAGIAAANSADGPLPAVSPVSVPARP
jgi:hypothetical protein